jgi:predicted small lipoprotein YifL
MLTERGLNPEASGTKSVSARFAYALPTSTKSATQVENAMDMSETKSGVLKSALVAMACVLSLSLAACEKKGPLEQAGEEIDEAVDTAKNGGEESTANKVDDAVDEVRKD